MADTKIVEKAVVEAVSQPIKDFDPELSELIRREIPDFEDLLFRRAEKGIPLKGE